MKARKFKTGTNCDNMKMLAPCVGLAIAVVSLTAAYYQNFQYHESSTLRTRGTEITESAVLRKLKMTL